MNNKYVNFIPWVGESYEKGYKGKRILVLGESHYCDDCEKCQKISMKEECHAKTEDAVSDFLDDPKGLSYKATYTCFERNFVGRELKQEEREEFWNIIIFYNFLQYAMSGPRCGLPEKEEIEESNKAFQEILETYRPDYIIVLGFRLYKLLPELNGEGKDLKVGNEKTEVWIYQIKDKKIPALKVAHPSSPKGKKREYWYKFIRNFLEKFAQNKLS